MSGMWGRYRDWAVAPDSGKQIQACATFGQLMFGYSGNILEYTWKNELMSTAVGLVEYSNSLVKTNHETGKPVDAALAIVKVLQLTQRAIEILLRIRLVGKVHWPWETPRKLLQVIVVIEAVKAVLLIKVNKHLATMSAAIRAYFRSLPRGKRSGIQVPIVATGLAAPIPPVLTIWDLLQPLADIASVLRPFVYSSLLLADHNKGRPWRALVISFLLELTVLAITFVKGKVESTTLNRPGRRGDRDATTSHKISRQLSRMRDYLLRDPVYVLYVKDRIAPLTSFLQRLPLVGFLVEYHQLRRLLYFDTSGS